MCFCTQGCVLCPVQWKNSIVTLDHWGILSPIHSWGSKTGIWNRCLCDSLAEAAQGPPLPSHPSSWDSSPPFSCALGYSAGMQWRQGCPQLLPRWASPSCTLLYSRAWVVLGKGTWNHLSPSLHAEETKAPKREVAFPSQFTCQDRTHDDSQSRVQPTRPWTGKGGVGGSLPSVIPPMPVFLL